MQAMQQMVSETERLADRLAASGPPAAPASPVVLQDADAKQLEAAQAGIQAFTERIAGRHGATEGRQVEQTYRHLRLTIAVNVAFVVLGTLLLVASHGYFRRAIALPLRQLTERASEIARGDRAGTVPVTSTDEIGRLNDAFNRMAAQLSEHEERSRGLVVLEERERLARELHDSLAQDLAFLRLKLLEADRSLGPDCSAETRTRVREMFAIVDGAYQNVREAIFGLHALDPAARGGLVAALGDYLDEFRRLRKIPVELEVSDAGALALPPHAEAQLIRIISEALTNVAKHAGATRGIVRMEREAAMARITIEDDGKGFAVDTSSEDGLHFGIKNMTDRARAAGGTLVVESAPGRGTRVVVRLPLARAGGESR
jgi:signal transduction histidine kinase